MDHWSSAPRAHTHTHTHTHTHLLVHAGEKDIGPPGPKIAIRPLRACRRRAIALFVYFLTHLLQGLEEKRLHF